MKHKDIRHNLRKSLSDRRLSEWAEDCDNVYVVSINRNDRAGNRHMFEGKKVWIHDGSKGMFWSKSREGGYTHYIDHAIILDFEQALFRSGYGLGSSRGVCFLSVPDWYKPSYIPLIDIESMDKPNPERQ
jgi:hypothetical protein